MTTPSAIQRFRFVVAGRVQGVGFRWAARTEAVRLGLVGYVRNRPDGAVEGEAQGDARGLETFRAWLRHGPPLARVERGSWDEIAAQAGEAAFAIDR